MKPSNIEIGSRIMCVRELHHLTQEKFSEKIKITAKHCSDVERGKTSISLNKLIEISQIFDVSLDYLVFGKNTSLNGMPPSLLDLYSQDDISKRDSFNELYYSFLNVLPYFRDYKSKL